MQVTGKDVMGPWKMGKVRDPAQASSKKWTKNRWSMALIRGTLVYHHR
jgi:hypothetical protein